MFDLVSLLYQSFGFDVPTYSYEIFLTTIILFTIGVAGVTELIRIFVDFGSKLSKF